MERKLVRKYQESFQHCGAIDRFKYFLIVFKQLFQSDSANSAFLFPIHQPDSCFNLFFARYEVLGIDCDRRETGRWRGLTWLIAGDGGGDLLALTELSMVSWGVPHWYQFAGRPIIFNLDFCDWFLVGKSLAAGRPATVLWTPYFEGNGMENGTFCQAKPLKS